MNLKLFVNSFKKTVTDCALQKLEGDILKKINIEILVHTFKT
jgi:hypothetical protein